MTFCPDTPGFALHSLPLPPPLPSAGLLTSPHLAYPWAHAASHFILSPKIRELHFLAQNPFRTLHRLCCKV